MTSFVTRDIEITYGLLVMGGTTERLIHDNLVVFDDYDRFRIEFDLVIQKDDIDDFNTEVAEVEDAIRTPNQDLIIKWSSTTTQYSKLHDSNTGFNGRGTIQKLGDKKFDTGRSRKYRVSIEVEQPADETGKNGRRTSTVTLRFSPARRRTLIIEGRYTALGANSARAQYLASIDAYTLLLTTAFGGTYEIVDEDDKADDEDKNLDFVRTLEEVIFNQSIGTLDDSSIVSQTLIIERDREAPGDTIPVANQNQIIESGDVKRLITINLTYEAWIDATVTTAIVSKFNTTIKKHLIAVARDTVGGGRVALVRSAPAFDFPQNRITATMTFLATDGSNIIEYRHTKDLLFRHGRVLVDLWSDDPFAKYDYQGPQGCTLTITDTFKVISTTVPGGGAVGGGARGGGGGGGVFGINVGGPGGGQFPGGGAGGPGVIFIQPAGPGAGAGGAPGVAAFIPPGSLKFPIPDPVVPITTRVAQTPLRLGQGSNTLDVIEFNVVRVLECARAPGRPGDVETPPS